MDRGEHLGILDAQPDEVVDVEEAAMVELARGGPPVRDAVALAPQERIEPVRVAVDAGDLAVDDRGELVIGAQPRDPLSEVLLPPVALEALLGGGVGPDVRQRLREPRDLARLIGAGAVRGAPDERRERRDRDRERAVLVPQHDAVALALDAQPALLEHAAVWSARTGTRMTSFSRGSGGSRETSKKRA